MNNKIENLIISFPNIEIITNKHELINVSKDESSLDGVIPQALIYPKDTSEIQNIIIWCNENSIPITTRGAGSSLEGNSIPSLNSIVLDLSKMNKIISYNDKNLTVLVEAGVIYDNLNNYLKDFSVFFPPSPGGSGDIATIGGMSATNASGIYSVKYGGTRDWILGFEVVTGKGDILNLGHPIRKSSSGYDLKSIICGSEGTLAIITKILLRLAGLPSYREKSAFIFYSEHLAIQSVTEILRYGIDVSAIEYIDKNSVRALNKLNNYRLVEHPLLFIEVHGLSNELVKESISQITNIINDNNGSILDISGIADPWQIRHELTKSIKLFDINKIIKRNDVVVPFDKLPEIVDYIYEKSEINGIEVFIFGHVGIGIIHVLMLADKNDIFSLSMVDKFNDEIIYYAININGSISGEHGIGLAHKHRFQLEHKESVQYMKNIKNIFDPNWILNPDKIFNN